MTATILNLESLWDRFADQGFSAGSYLAAGFYPMPGSVDFDDDDAFLDMPVFPPDGPGLPTLVRDDEWAMPLAWLRSFETRPRSQRAINFGLPVRPNASVIEKEACLFVRRSTYLELFRSRKPRSVSTIRQNAMVYVKIAKYAIECCKRVSDLDYVDLLSAIDNLSKFQRGRLASMHEMMRWWKGSSPERFTGYNPPPTAETLDDDQTVRPGFNADRVRSDDDAADVEDRKWQPLPDEFVAIMGEWAIWVNNHLRPRYHDFLRDLIQADPETSNESIRSLAKSYNWPEGYEITGVNTAKRLGNICQFSTIFLVSLMLGPRWSEVAALPRKALVERADGTFLLDGSTFKFSQNLSGEQRDWPIHPELARALSQQQEYIDLTEAPEYTFLWRQHTTVIGGNEPLKQVHGLLNDMLKHVDCEHLLNGTSFHHHRFRKTAARLIVLALHGGPMVLRRLFGHQHLGTTLRYILANQSIVDELREIAEEEQRRLASKFVERRSDLIGGGAKAFEAALSRVIVQADIYVPEGKREQTQITTDDVLDVLSADAAEGLYLKQIVPGLIACFKPNDEAGMCCKVGELPNVARCSMQCKWHLEMPEYRVEAHGHVASAITHLKAAEQGSLRWTYYAEIVRSKLSDFPHLLQEFGNDPLVIQVLGARP